MIHQPVIVYIGEGSSEWNGPKDALFYVLRTEYQCDVIEYASEYYFHKDLARIKNLYRGDLLLCVIVNQLSLSRQHLAVIQSVRAFSSSTPIIVIPAGPRDEVDGVGGYKRIYRYYLNERRMITLVKRWRQTVTRPLDHFGAESKGEAHLICRQLAHVYHVQYLQDDRELGVPDDNGQVIAQALRVRLTSAHLVRAEFDEPLQGAPLKLQEYPVTLYSIELERLRALCQEDPCELRRNLNMARGGRLVGSEGDDAEGFAIDPVTLQYERTSGCGTHKSASFRLELRLESIRCLKGKKWSKTKQRVVGGTLLSQVEGFSVPIVLFRSDFVKPKEELRIAQFFKFSKMAIPIVQNFFQAHEFRIMRGL